MALEAVNRKSKLVVHNSATDLVDKTPLEGYQGAAIEDVVNFEKIVDDLASVTKTDARAQGLKFGESFFQIAGSGAIQYVCTGEYGKTLIHSLNLTSSCTGTHVNTGSSPVSTDITLTGGSASTSSDICKAEVIIAADGSLTSVIVSRRGTNYKAGDTFVIPGNTIGAGGATPANDLTITLTQANLNNAEIVERSFTD